MKHCVVTLDLVSSRRLPDRKGVQEELKEVLKVINDHYFSVLEAPFNFTLGDEVQGVLNTLTASYPLICEFHRYLEKYPFYAGVGFGEIVTKMSKRSGEMDGSAFHLARSSIDQLKSKYIRLNGHSSNRHFVPLICYNFEQPELTNIVNNYLWLIELLKYNLTDKQREVYWLLFQTSTYSEIAILLNQSKSAITQKVQAGHLEEIRAGEEGLMQFLHWIEVNQG